MQHFPGGSFTLACLALTLCTEANAQGSPSAAESKASTTLFQNVRIFNGRDAALSAPSNVLVRGNVIERISTGAIEPGPSTTIVAGGSRTLMPGLIDAHWHSLYAGTGFVTALTADLGYLNLAASKAAEATLMSGFTTVRDMGGPAFGLKRAIDEGIVAGPRIFPSGAMITQTSGHGDFRQLNEIPREPNAPLNHMERSGGAAVADGVDEVLRRVREQFMLGASQVKLTAGGGVASPHSPIDVSAFTDAELRAAVEAADNWGTYVAVHAYTPRAIQAAIAAGVKCVEHGHLMDETSAKMLSDKGIWLSTQPFVDEEPNPQLTPESQQQKLQVAAGTNRTYELAKKYHIKTAFGTDILFDPRSAARQGAQLARLVRWYTPGEALKQATGSNGELLALSGLRSPYVGKLGVVEQGALADLLLVDGNPLDDIRVVEDPAKNFVVIMKDGKIYKNTVAR